MTRLMNLGHDKNGILKGILSIYSVSYTHLIKPLLRAYLKSQQKIYIADLKKKLEKYSHRRNKK